MQPNAHDDPTLPAADADSAPSGQAPRAFRAGDLIAQRWRVVRFIAAGGMGEVYDVRDLAQLAIALQNRGATLGRAGRLRATADAFREAISVAEQAGERLTVAMARQNLAITHLELADLSSARREIEAAASAIAGLDAPYEQNLVRMIAGALAVEAGDLERAEALLAETKVEPGLLPEQVLVTQGELRLAQGRLGEAEDLARRSIRQCQELGISAGEDMAQELLARILLRAGRIAEADAAVVRALALMGERAESLEAYRTTRARVLAAQQRQPEAEQLLLEAMAQATANEHIYRGMQAELALAEIELQQGRRDEARSRLERLARAATSGGLGTFARRVSELLPHMGPP